jgi:radical SAM-linked protein
LAQIPGVYVPQFYEMTADGSVQPNRPDVPEQILRRVATPIPAYSIGLVPFVETVHDRLTIEIRRGCTRGCRFCQPGMLTRPARDVEPQQVIETVEQGMRATGYNEFSLLSLSCSDYLALPAVGVEIRNRLKDENISLSLPSQRVDRFDENIAHIVGGLRQSSLTFAPEAGTQRLRDIVNKGLTNEELLQGVKTAYELGWNRVKLYFMIGLPGETDADVLGIAETIRWLQRECRGKGKKPLGFTVTISNFTPKPHTPFQWHSVSTAEFERKQSMLRQEFRTIRGLKANFTDVRISAMEDFLGRGDRRLSSVIHRAWQLGAGMDAWWESLDRAFAAWTQAIAESDLTWKYRQIEAGEWNVFAAETNPKAEAVDTAQSHPSSLFPHMSSLSHPSLDAALPWDHIDTGISKEWLKADLERALEAAIVPDCSFDGCSHCGVCGVDFGHNVVIPPPAIPQFTGQFVPNTERVQRLRVWFGKHGQMALLSHLDLARLFDRAIRRAAIPIAFTGGFHPGPRISFANALSLGVTSSSEIVDVDLVQPMAATEFRNQLAAQLPPGLPIYQVESIQLQSPSATQLLERAEYLITICPVSTDATLPTPDQWQTWIETILATDTISIEQTTKSGKVKLVNLRERLFELQLVDTSLTSEKTGSFISSEPIADLATTVRFVGSCRNDGTLLRPEHIVYMIESVANQEWQLLQAHRNRLILQTV